VLNFTGDRSKKQKSRAGQESDIFTSQILPYIKSNAGTDSQLTSKLLAYFVHPILGFVSRAEMIIYCPMCSQFQLYLAGYHCDACQRSCQAEALCRFLLTLSPLRHRRLGKSRVEMEIEWNYGPTTDHVRHALRRHFHSNSFPPCPAPSPPE